MSGAYIALVIVAFLVLAMAAWAATRPGPDPGPRGYLGYPCAGSASVCQSGLACLPSSGGPECLHPPPSGPSGPTGPVCVDKRCPSQEYICLDGVCFKLGPVGPGPEKVPCRSDADCGPLFGKCVGGFCGG
jgi:hypothetical protein